MILFPLVTARFCHKVLELLLTKRSYKVRNCEIRLVLITFPLRGIASVFEGFGFPYICFRLENKSSPWFVKDYPCVIATKTMIAGDRHAKMGLEQQNMFTIRQLRAGLLF
ncbi:MAG: hypothetical protein Q8Q55_01365 [Undibacterium sp.]|nr:hypothetical protein [Undibacterium sp.]